MPCPLDLTSHALIVLLLIPVVGANLLLSTVALLVLATYKELLTRVGLQRLVLLNLLCGSLEVLYSILVCMCQASPLSEIRLLSVLF